MGATEEQMDLVSGTGIGHVSYVLILYSFASLIFLFTNILLHLYGVLAAPSVPGKDVVNGNGHAARQQVRDAEEFELEGLMSDDEDNEEGALSSPSTVGKNNEARVQ